MQVVIIGIGTEVASGQILNSNATWLAQKLDELGLKTTAHITVPDEHQLMLKALRDWQSPETLYFVTGGLGPTRDDFTREVIAEWTQKKLIFNASVWQQIESRLNERGVIVREMQKQQAFFPETAEILPNNLGTADGFYLQYQGQSIFVLPGPPREIEALWPHVLIKLKNLTQHLPKQKTLIWNFLGTGESEIAHLTEQALKDYSHTIGYRVHAPFVEVKLIFPEAEHKHAALWQNKLEQELKDYLYQSPGLNILETFINKLSLYHSFAIEDLSSGTYLFSRLNKLLGQSKNFIYSQRTLLDKMDLTLSLKRISTTQAKATWQTSVGSGSCLLNSRYKANLAHRCEQELVEKCFKFWSLDLPTT